MLTKAVVRQVTKITVERSWLKIARVHCTKVRIHSADNPRPIELLLFSSEQVPIEQITAGATEGAAETVATLS